MARRQPADTAALEERLGHRFADPALLTSALTHGSAATNESGRSNQRLEFLGDRVLGLAVADLLMESFPAASEGDLSRRLAWLVRRETCAEVAGSWGLGPHLRIGGGGAIRARVSVLGDACEAVIGAVFLDGGFMAARDLVRRSFGGRLAGLATLPANPKAELQEWAAGLGRPPPVYDIVEKSGPDHAPRFAVAARVQGIAEAVGAGPSRRAAEQAAAEAVLVREGLRTARPDGAAATGNASDV